MLVPQISTLLCKLISKGIAKQIVKTGVKTSGGLIGNIVRKPGEHRIGAEIRVEEVNESNSKKCK